MPLITTAASASAKGYGFGLESSVDETASVTGLAASGLIGNASVVIPKPVPANQYWTLLSKIVSGNFYTLYANLFSFTSNPSPSISILVQEQALVGSFNTNVPSIFRMKTTTSGRVYVSMPYKTGTPNTGSSVHTFDVSAGTIGTKNVILQFGYVGGGGAENFIAIQDLSVTPSRTRIATTYNYSNPSTLNRFGVFVGSISGDGLTTTTINPINPVNVNIYNQRVIAINPVADNIIAIGGNSFGQSFSNPGYVWLYKNWGVSLQESVNIYQATGNNNAAVNNLAWSNSGEYLFSSSLSTNEIRIWKVNFNTGVLTQVYSVSQSSSPGAFWTVRDESVVLGATNNALVRTGDNFTFVAGPGAITLGSAPPALNYNGQYLFAASTGTEQVRVFEYDGPSFFDTAVISVNNGGREYLANGSFPMFDGLE